MSFLLIWLLLFFNNLAQAENIADMLKNSILAHNQSATYKEWKSSPFHPHQIFEKYQTLKQRSHLSSELCAELEKLNTEDLSLFYNELSLWTHEQSLPCLEKILKTNADFYNISSSQMLLDFYVKGLQNDIFDQNTPPKLGPSRIELVETINGPIFWYGEKGLCQKKELALTFDDGPHPTLTPQLLDILNSEDVQVTFFTVGKNISKYGDIINDILIKGHTLGTHSYSHRDLPRLELETAKKDINDAFDTALDKAGIVAPFFRFPFGSKNKKLTEFVRQSQWASFFWDVDTLDWKKKDPQELLEYVLQEITKANRGIVLFHDIQPQTISIMPTLLQELKVQGYKLVVYQPTEWIE
ncbi:MAG: polysaccharide deacetylase family protein [Bdellovibrionales bacterium]|nr:polysaccharide deacetylase family protein [Bdellovibrionales bacterium]